ncbi:MAG: hypothetical protein AAGD35_09450 [Actinomycetota bacterium]
MTTEAPRGGVTFLRRSPKQSRSRRRVDELLDAAAQLLDEAGPSGTTITAVAARTGQPSSSVYEWVAGERELIAATAERALGRLHLDLVESLGTPATAEEAHAAIDAALTLFLDRYRSEPGLRAGLAFLEADPELSAINLADSRRNAAAVADAIRPFATGTGSGRLDDTVLLLIHLSGALARLCDQVSGPEARRLEAEFRAVLAILLAP